MTMLPDIDEGTYTDWATQEFERKQKERQGGFNFMQGVQERIGGLQETLGGFAGATGEAIGGAASALGTNVDAQRQQLQQVISQGAPQQTPEALSSTPGQQNVPPPEQNVPDFSAQQQQLQSVIGQHAQTLGQPFADLGQNFDQQRQQLQDIVSQVPKLNAPPLAPTARGGDLHDYARQAAQQAGIDPDIFERQIQQESGFNINAGGPAGARGIAQIVPEYHPGVDPSDPYASLDYAANLMKSHLRKYGGDYATALAAYNAGPAAVDRYGGPPPFEETQRYVSTILGGTGQSAPAPTPAEGLSRAGAALGAANRDISQFGDAQLSNEEAYSACGPAAAVRFAQRFGRNPTLREATDLAATVGWTAERGMAGIASEQALLSKLGVESKLLPGAQWDKFAAEAQTGNPVTISTAGHYFYADGYNPDTGQFHVGRSGSDLRNGSEWMTAQQMTNTMGAVQGGLLASNPTVQAGSTAQGGGGMFDQAIASAKSAVDPFLERLRAGSEEATTRGRAWLDEQAANLDRAVQIAGQGAGARQVAEQAALPGGAATPIDVGPEPFNYSDTLTRQLRGEEDAQLGPLPITIPGRVAGTLGLLGEPLHQLDPTRPLARAYEGTFGELRRDPELMQLAEQLNAAEMRQDSVAADALRQQVNARYQDVLGGLPMDVQSIWQRGGASPDLETAELLASLVGGAAATALAPQGLASGVGKFATSLALDPSGAPFAGLGEVPGLIARGMRGAPRAGEAAAIVSRTGEDIRPGLYAPGEAGTMLPRAELPNFDLWESRGGRFGAGGEGGYHPPPNDVLSPLSPGTKGENRIRQTVADLEWNPRFPRDLTDPDANQFAGDLRKMGEGLATGDWTPEQTAMSAILTKLSMGRSQAPVTKLFEGLGEEWVARHMPSLQAQGAVPGGKAASYGLVIRPEVLATHIAGDTANPQMMQLLTAIGTQALDELPPGTPAHLASFATRAERLAVIDRGTDELFRLFSAGGQGGARGDDVLIKGQDITRVYNKGTPEEYTQISSAAKRGRQGWSETVPALHEQLLEWGQKTGRYEGLDDAARKDLLLQDIQKAKVAGIGIDKATFVPNMGFAPDYATLDLRMRRQGFGISPKAKLTRAERNLLEKKIIEANPEAEGGYVSQWLPWAYMTDEKTDYRSIPRAYQAVGDLMKQARQVAQEQNRPIGEVVSQLAQETPRVPLEIPPPGADIVSRIGVSPKAVKALAPGTAGDDLYRAVPEVKALARQAGVDYVEKPSIGTGLGFDPQGNPVTEPDANLVVRGTEAANRWFGAAWLKANPNEASVMLAHTGPGVENATDSLGTIRLANGALDASILVEAATDFSPFGWHMTSKLNRAGQAMVTDIVIGGVEVPAEKFAPRFEEFANVLEKHGYRLKSRQVEPARIEFLEQADVEGVLQGGPRGARRGTEGGPAGVAGEVAGGGPVGYGAERRAFTGPEAGRTGEDIDQLRGAAPAAEEAGLAGRPDWSAGTPPSQWQTGTPLGEGGELWGAKGFVGRADQAIRNRAVQGAVRGGVAGGYEASREEGATPLDVLAGAAKGAPLGAAHALVPGSRGLLRAGRLGAIAEAAEGEGGFLDSPEVARLVDLARTRGLDPATLFQREISRLENVPPHLAESVSSRLENLRGALDEVSRPAEAARPVADEAARAVGEAERIVEEAKPVVPPPLSEDARTRAGNLRLDKYVPDEVRDVIADVWDATPDAMQAATRSVTPDQAVREMAADLGVSEKTLLSRWKPGRTENAETIYAMRQSLANEGRNVLIAQRAVRREPANADAQIALINALTRAQAVEEAVAGYTAEAGRALRQFRQPIEGQGVLIQRLLKLARAKKIEPDELGKMLSEVNLEDPKEALKLAQILHPRNKWADRAWALWYFSMLSTPTTHLRNITGNTLTAAMTPVESTAASIMDLPARGLIKAIGGRTSGRERFLGEAWQDVKGLTKPLYSREGGLGVEDADAVGAAASLPTALRRAVRAYAEEAPIEDILSGHVAPEAFRGKAGAVIHAPGRSLRGEDAFFKALNESAAAHRMAYREAKRAGLSKPDDIAAWMADMMKNPDEDFLKEVVRQGKYRTFNADSGVANAMMSFRKKVPAMRYLMPFVRTPWNIAKYTAERSPLGAAGIVADFLSKGGRESLRTRGAGDLADRMGRASIGSLIAYGLAQNRDRLTGRVPDDPTERDAFYRQGKQPYSMKIGDSWHSYQPLQPYSPLFAAVANAGEQMRKDPSASLQDTLPMAALAFGQGLTDQPWTQGLADFFDLWGSQGEPGDKFNQYVTRQAGGAVPGIVRALARAHDRTIRDPQNVLEGMLQNVPFLEDRVAPKQNVWGSPRQRPTGGAESLYNIFNSSRETSDPVEQELAALQKRGYEVEPGFVGKNLSVLGQPTEITDEQQRTYQRGAGQSAYAMLSLILGTPEYKALSEADKAKLIDGIVSDTRSTVREMMTPEFMPQAFEAFKRQQALRAAGE